MPDNKATYAQMATDVALREGVDPALATSIMQAESAFNPRATSPAGAQGLMQLMPGTAARFGVTDAYDPQQNIEGGVKYLKFLQKAFPNNPALQAAAYNAGEGAVRKHGGVPPYKETQGYVQRVLALLGLAPGVAHAGTTGSDLDREMQREMRQVSSTRADQVAPGYLAQKAYEVDRQMAREMGLPAPPPPTPQAQTPPPAPAPTLMGRLGRDALQIVGGARDAFVESMQTLNILGDWMREHGIGPSGKLEVSIPQVPAAGTVEGDLIRGASQFLTALLPASKAMGAIGVTGRVAKGLAAGALADVVAMGPSQARMSNLINELAPGLRNPLTEFLAATPEDSAALGKFKNALEGLALGGLTEGVVRGAQALRSMRKVAEALPPQAVEALGGTPPARPATARPPGLALTDDEIQAAIQTERIASEQAFAQSVAKTTDALAAIGTPEGKALVAAELKQAKALVADAGVVLGRGQDLHRFDTEDEAARFILEKRLARLQEQGAGRYSPMGALRRALGTDPEAQRLATKEMVARFMDDQAGDMSSQLLGGDARRMMPLVPGDIPARPPSVPAPGSASGASALPELTGIQLPVRLQSRARQLVTWETVDLNDPTLRVVASQFHAELQAGVGVTGQALPTTGRQAHINFDRIQTSEDIKLVISSIADVVAESAEMQRRGIRSMDEVAREAARSKYQQLDHILGITPGTALNDTDTYAVRSVWLSAARNLRDVSLLYEAGEATADDWMKAFAIASNVHTVGVGVRAEPARAMRVFGVDMAAGERDFLERVGGVMSQGLGTVEQRVGELTAQAPVVVDRAAKDEAIAVMARRLAALPSDEALAKFVTDAQRATGTDILTEAWYGALLSNPSTHVVNMVDGAMRVAWAIPERYLAVGHGVTLGEANQFAYGLKGGLSEAWQAAKRIWETGVSAFGEASKVEGARREALTGEALGLAEGTWLHDLADILGHVVRAPGKALMTTDEFFKSINYRMEVHARAYREAMAEGLEGPQLAARIAALVEDPPPGIAEGARQWANVQTLAQPLTQEGAAFETAGRITQHLVDAQQESIAMRIVLPFIRTPFNIARYGAERSPLGLLSTNVRQQLIAEGPEGALARSQMALGTSLMTIFGLYATEDRVTGAAPKDPGLRATWERAGKLPYSIRVGDTWIQYNRVEQPGMLLGLAADFALIARQAPEKEAQNLAGMALTALFNNFTSKTYLKGMADIVDAITTPPGESDVQAAKGMEQYLSRLLQGLVPSGVGAVARAMDPNMRQVHGVFDGWINRVPGWSTTLPLDLDLWGRPRMRPEPVGPDLLSPFMSREHQSDAVDQELLAQQTPVRMPSKVVRLKTATGQETVELTPQQYNAVVMAMNAPGEGQTLKGALETIIASPGYQELSDGMRGGKSALLMDTIQKFQAAGLAKVQGEDKELAALLERRTLMQTLSQTKAGQETLHQLPPLIGPRP